MNATSTTCPFSSIGGRFNPIKGEQLENPYPFYEEARRDEPVFFSSALQMWIVTDYRTARAVLGDAPIFSSAESLDNIVELCPEALAVLATGVPPAPFATNSDEPDHRRWRRVLNASLSASRMRRLEPLIREITQARLDVIAPLGRAEILSELGYPVPLQVIARLCDVGDEHLANLARWAQSFVALISSASEPARQIDLAKDLVAYQQFLQDHVDRKRAQPGDDVVSQLIGGHGEAPFSDVELVNGLVNLFVAGHDTTANLIGNALYHLLSRPNHWHQMVADPASIPAVVEEALRIDPSVPTFIRTATSDTMLGGRAIRKGDKVVVVFASANHDGNVFANPETFDPQRKNKGTHLAFGHGIHACVGASLARLQIRVVLEMLAARLPSLRLAPDRQFQRMPTLIIRGFESLYVEWD